MKATKKTLLWKIVAIAMGVLGVSSIAMANVSLRELLVEKLADKVPVNRLLANLGLGEEEDKSLGLAVINTSNSGLTNVRIGGALQRGSSSSTGNYSVSQFDVETHPVTTNTIAFQNTRTASSTVNIEVVERGVVSSSFKYACGSSATPFVHHSLATPSELVASTVFPTSTFGKIISSITATSSMSIGPQQYLVCAAQTNWGTATAPTCGGGTGTDYCEQVTSSNRGWSLDIRTMWNWFEGTSF